MKPRIICNQIKTPDGTILISHSAHEYVEHLDRITGKVYAVVGGNDYLKRFCITHDYEELSITSEAPFEIIRENYYRGSWDKDGNRVWIPMYKMSNEHLKNCISYNIKLGLDKDCFSNQMYEKELQYRKENNIFMGDKI